MTPSARRTLLFRVVYLAMFPLLSLVYTDLLWQETQNASVVIAFFWVYYLSVPLGCYLNAPLLSRFNLTGIMGVTLIASTLPPLLLLTQPYRGWPIYFLMAMLYGLVDGALWSNYYYLVINALEDSQRNFFSATIAISEQTINIIIPPLAGLVVVLGSRLPIPNAGFLQANAIVLLIAIGGAYVIRSVRSQFKPVIPKRMTWVTHPSRSWRIMRQLQFFEGISEALGFLPYLMSFMVMKNEAEAGAVIAMSTVVTFVVLYLWGRFGKIQHRSAVVVLGASFDLLSAIAILFLPGAARVIAYQALACMGGTLTFISLEPISAAAITQEGPAAQKDYRYIFDGEVFINLGRLCILGVSCLLFAKYPESALFLTVVVVSIAQLGKIWMVRQYQRNQMQTCSQDGLGDAA